MNWSEDELMAFADGELAGERRDALASALQGDPGLRRRVATLQAQRRRVSAAFAGVLDEPVPDRLAALLAPPAAGAPAPGPADLAAERARRAGHRAGPSWAQWGGMAASVALGVALGWQIGPPGADAVVRAHDGQWVASGRLAQALASQLAGDAAGGLAMPLSFLDKDGRYCRTFSTGRLAGLACRDASGWAVQATTPAERPETGALRQAGSALPRALLEAVDARIAGTALTAAEEQQARDRGWIR